VTKKVQINEKPEEDAKVIWKLSTSFVSRLSAVYGHFSQVLDVNKKLSIYVAVW
jgi:hypothetical protein